MPSAATAPWVPTSRYLTAEAAGRNPSSSVSPVPPELTRRLVESYGTMTPFGWPLAWQAYQFSPLAGAGGFPYRGASGTTNDRAYGRDIPFFWSEVDLRGYRVTSRYIAETNPFAIGFCTLLVGYHVRKGFGWQACKKGAKKGPYATAVQASEERAFLDLIRKHPTDYTTRAVFADWLDEHSQPVRAGRVRESAANREQWLAELELPEGDNTGRLIAKAQQILDQFRDANQWPTLSREAFLRSRVDGEVFLRLGCSAPGSVPWARVVEPEQVGAPDGSTTDPWSYGIDVLEYPDGRIDPLQVLAYHVWDLESGMTEGEWVDSRFMVHAKSNVVQTVKRGRPDFFPLLDTFEGIDQLVSNMLASAVRQAAIAWLEQFPTATAAQMGAHIPQTSTGGGQSVPTTSGQAPAVIPGLPDYSLAQRNYIPPGSIYRTEGNREIKPNPGSPGFVGWIEVEKLACRTARMRWNLPGSASGDAEDTTFAAAIQAGGPFPVAVEGSQLAWGAGFERPSALKVLDLAVDAGMLSRAQRAELDVETTEPAVVTPQPDKDTVRREQLNRAKVLSVTTWQLQEGLDPQHEAENFAAEAKRAQEAGGANPAAGGPPDPNAPPGGGDPGDGGGLFGESLSESQYQMLTEAGRAGLVQRDVTFQRDGKSVTQKRWVKAASRDAGLPAGSADRQPTDPAPAKKTEPITEPSSMEKAIYGPGGLDAIMPKPEEVAAKNERRHRDAAAAQAHLDSAKERPLPKHLQAATKFKDVARRRRIVAALKTEAELAEAVGGINEPDSRPADVLYVEDAHGNRIMDPEKVRAAMKLREASVKILTTGKIHRIGKSGQVEATDQDADAGYRELAQKVLRQRCEAFEVKTILTNSKHAVYMNPKAKRRKENYAKRHMVSFHVVAVDRRKGAKHSGHEVYVSPHHDVSKKASGTVKLDDMQKVGSLAEVGKVVQA